jgi:hypothetical protein
LLAAGAGLLGSRRVFAQAAPPRRFIAVYHPNGCFPSRWFPTGSETAFTLGPSLMPLEPHRGRCLFLSGVDLKVAVDGQGEQHQRGLGAFLTGRKLQAGLFVGNDGTTAGWADGPSLDQLLVPLLGAGAAAASLQLGVHCVERDVSGVLSYAGAAKPLLAVNDPAQTFRTLFGSGGTAAEMEKLRRRRASVLDTVAKQFPLAKRRLSAADQQRLDEHLQLVRDLEARVTAVPSGACMAPQAPPATMFASESSMPEVAKLQIDLLVKALQCDLARVATLAFSDAKNHIGMPFAGVAGDVHNVSHLPDSDPSRLELASRDAWVAEQVAYLVAQLAATSDANGPLLDSTLVLWGSELGQGNLHSHANVPCVLAGSAPGLRMGRYLAMNGASWNDLLLTVYRSLGGSGNTFGDAAFSSGALSLS